MTHDWLRIDSIQSAITLIDGDKPLKQQIQQLITEALDTTLDVSDPIVHNRLLVHYMEQIEELLR